MIRVIDIETTGGPQRHLGRDRALCAKLDVKIEPDEGGAARLRLRVKIEMPEPVSV